VPTELVPFADTVAAIEKTEFTDLAAEVLWISRKIQQFTGVEPIAVDLSTSADFSVVKIIAPGLRFANRHVAPRPRYAAAI